MKARLTVFLTVSALIHGALLVVWQDRRLSLQLAIGGQAQALRVSLAPAPPTASTPRELAALETPATAPPAERPPATAPPRPAPVRKRARPVAPPPPPARQIPPTATREPAAVTARAPQPASSTLNVSERISAALQNRLRQRFVYPWLARKRGWQGMVTLSLQVEDDGQLTHWRVSKTSGYSLLDRSALEAARAIGRLQEADELLDGESLQLSLPVRYRLLDS